MSHIQTVGKKSALITGASSGIGKAMAFELARRGINLCLMARRKELLESVCKEIEEQYPVKVMAAVGDVTQREDLDLAVKTINKEFGRLDYVFANAGFGVSGRVSELKIADYERQFGTNVFGMINTVQATLPEIKKTKGSYCLIGSVLGYLSGPSISPYSMSKAAVRALSESLSAELAKDGVAVTHICPGFVASEIHQVNNKGVFDTNQKSMAPAFLVMPTNKAARKIVNAVIRRKRELVFTLHGKLGVFIQRHFPGLIAFAQKRANFFA